MRSKVSLCAAIALLAFSLSTAEVSASPTTFSHRRLAQAPLPSETRPLQPFSSVALCAPLNLLIKPDPGNNYAFTVAAEQAVLPNVKAVVGPDAVLSVTANGPITTNQPIQLTVSLPANALTAIAHNGPNAAIYVAPGFNVAAINLTTGFGAGELYANSITAQRVNITHHGLGNLIVRGQLGSATATSDAISKLYLSGVQTSAELNLASTADAFVEQAPTSSITGTAAGLNRVFYTTGNCQMNSPFSTVPGLALTTCTQQAFLNVPPPQPTWTCGIQMQGNFTCRPGRILSLGPSGSSVSQAGAGTLLSTTPGGFVSQGPTAGGTQMQAGQAQPGQAAAQSGISGTGSVSSSASATSTSSGSTSTTQTAQNGVSQGFTTTSGGQTQSFSSEHPGVLVAYDGQPPESASATNEMCNAALDATRIPV